MNHRRTLIGLAMIAVLLAGALAWLQQRRAAPPAAAEPAPSAARPAAQARPPAVQASAATSSQAPAQAPRAAVQPQAASSGLSGRHIADLGLTRQLAGEHRIAIEGRSFLVVGTKETVDGSGQSATMLLIVDELSGQVRYHLPGLQFVLKPGVDYETFIREHPRMRRLFVNPLYAQVAVDAAEIADQFQRLQRDPRVERIRLMTRDAPRKPR